MTIVKTTGVCGGVARVEGTRIPVWIIVDNLAMRVSNEDIIKSYPALRNEDITDCSDYYIANPLEILNDITEHYAEDE